MLVLAVSAFLVAALYGIFGNVIVWLMLTHRKVPLRFIWSGAPFYLYRVCNRMSPPSPTLKAFALSTNVALILAVPLLIWVFAASP
jgi:hypothetical protein